MPTVNRKLSDFDSNQIQTNIALLGFKTAVAGSLAKYDLQDQIIDEYAHASDISGIDAGASTNHILTTGSYGARTGGTGEATTTFDVNGASADVGTLQSHTFHAGTTSATIEGWGGRGSASKNSWKKNNSGTLDNTSSVAEAEEGGGFTVRLKGTYSGFAGGETIKIAVGKFGESSAHASTGSNGYGCHSGGGGASWVLLEHASTIGQTRGVANGKAWTPLLVAGGGGGAATRHDASIYLQGQSPWTIHGETDANLATANGATRQGTVDGSTLTASNTGKYTTGTDDGEGGTSIGVSGGEESGGGGAGFLADGGDPVGTWDGYGTDAGGSHPFHGTIPFVGGADAYTHTPSNSQGRTRGGYGGGGGGNIGGAGGGGGFSGGSSSGAWSTHGCNGIGGGSLFGSTVAIGAGYNNAITFTQVTNVLADGGDASPAPTGKMQGQVIIVETYSTIVVAPLTLQSTDTTAEAVPTTADMVILVEDAGTGVGVVNTNIKGWVSRYETGGTKTWTQGTLVDEGDWGTDKRILAFHDLDISGQASGTQMAYKITTHSASEVYDTNIHATSLGWK